MEATTIRGLWGIRFNQKLLSILPFVPLKFSFKKQWLDLKGAPGCSAVKTSCEVQEKGHPTPHSHSSSLRLDLGLTPGTPWRGRIKGSTSGSLPPAPEVVPARCPQPRRCRLSPLSGARFPSGGPAAASLYCLSLSPCIPASPHLSNQHTSNTRFCSAPTA